MVAPRPVRRPEASTFARFVLTCRSLEIGCLGRHMLTEIVDALYEAAFIPEKWPAILAWIATLAASKNGVLFVFADGAPGRGKTTPSHQALMNEILSDESLRLAPAAIAARLSIQPAGFVDADSL